MDKYRSKTDFALLLDDIVNSVNNLGTHGAVQLMDPDVWKDGSVYRPCIVEPLIRRDQVIDILKKSKREESAILMTNVTQNGIPYAIRTVEKDNLLWGDKYETVVRNLKTGNVSVLASFNRNESIKDVHITIVKLAEDFVIDLSKGGLL